MKNFVFISPNFPVNYWKFCAELKNNGLRVLGIGDCPYDNLMPELKDSLHEYYKVSSLENYDEVYRAVAFFIHKYGRIHWLESNNEYWLIQDARLRTDFHITSGFQETDMEPMKHKSAMKEFYKRAGVPTARYHLVSDYETTAAFIHEVGYPVVAKPDNGVGANNTYKLYCDSDLHALFCMQDMSGYIVEPFVKGYVQTYDAILNSKGEAVFESSLITPVSCMDTVSENTESLYYAAKEINPKVKAAGQRVIAEYGVRSRFVHLEFFVLTEDQEGLGLAGDVIGLEVNMRPAGGTSPDMYNYANETDVFKIWADMIAFDRNTLPMDRPHHYSPFIGRRDHKNYKISHNAVMEKYGRNLKVSERAPDALSALMANQYYIATFDTEEEMWQFYNELRETW